MPKELKSTFSFTTSTNMMSSTMRISTYLFPSHFPFLSITHNNNLSRANSLPSRLHINKIITRFVSFSLIPSHWGWGYQRVSQCSWALLFSSANYVIIKTNLVTGAGFEPATFRLWAWLATSAIIPWYYKRFYYTFLNKVCGYELYILLIFPFCFLYILLLSLFRLPKVSVKEWQFGHSNWRFSSLLLRQSPSIWWI